MVKSITKTGKHFAFLLHRSNRLVAQYNWGKEQHGFFAPSEQPLGSKNHPHDFFASVGMLHKSQFIQWGCPNGTQIPLWFIGFATKRVSRRDKFHYLQPFVVDGLNILNPTGQVVIGYLLPRPTDGATHIKAFQAYIIHEYFCSIGATAWRPDIIGVRNNTDFLLHRSNRLVAKITHMIFLHPVGMLHKS